MRWHPRFPLRIAFTAFLVAGPALFVLLAAHAPLPVILADALVDGASGTLFNVLWFTALQSEIPAEELSRVSSWDYLGSLALQPVGQVASGPIAIAIGVSTTLYAAGGLFLLTGSVILPIKSLLMNALTVSAAFGLLVLIFQDGRLQGLLRYTSQGALSHPANPALRPRVRSLHRLRGVPAQPNQGSA